MHLVIKTRILSAPSKTVFRYLLPVLKIYSARNVYYKFSVLTVNIGIQPKSHDYISAKFHYKAATKSQY